MKIKEGDIFTLNAVRDRISVGQILQKNKYNIYVVVFSKLYDSTDSELKNLGKLIDDIPAIVGRTSGLFFKLKRWTVIGNLPKAERSDFYPNYKIETLNGVFITTFDRQVIRKASKSEENFYTFYNDLSPAYVVSALKAFHGLQELDEDYIRLTYDFIKKRSNASN